MMAGGLLSLAVVIMVTLLTTQSEGNQVTPSCPPEDAICKFNFVVANQMTMMKYPKDSKRVVPVEILPNGTWLERGRPCGAPPREITDPQEKRLVVTADGGYKTAMLINGQLPGPPIVVYEGQEVVVNVANNLINEAVTIHWHGVHQRNTPWMDGVAAITQCGINPGEEFVYRFLATPAGTHFYHSHHGTLRSEGLYGALIILPRPGQENKNRMSDPLPPMTGDMYAILQDWRRTSSLHILHRDANGLTGYDGYSLDSACYTQPQAVDGAMAGVTPFESALINGKGRRFQPNGSAENPGLPLEIYTVRRGGTYRLRLVNAGLEYPFRVSIDGHTLNVISTEASDVKTVQVESVIIFGGERYDVWINATDPLNEGNYWIRTETLEYKDSTDKMIQAHYGLAMLRYEGAPSSVEPRTRRRACTGEEPCRVLNCPYRFYPAGDHTICIPVTELRTTLLQSTHEASQESFTELFLNFHDHLNAPMDFLPNVNGRHMLLPKTPPQTYPPSSDWAHPCNNTQCDLDTCQCTHLQTLSLGHVVQLVLFSTSASTSGNSPHPIHLHGHAFQVVKIGWPQYNETTAQTITVNDEISCVLNENCQVAEWADASWRSGMVPGIVTQGAPLKDSIAVPVGGYVVIRFKADNPGYWFLHCHMEIHSQNGMSVLLQEGDIADMNMLPRDFPTCGSFDWSEREFRRRESHPVSPMIEGSIKSGWTGDQYQIATIALAVACSLIVCIAAYVIYKNKTPKGYDQI